MSSHSIEDVKPRLSEFTEMFNKILPYDDRSAVLCVSSFAESVLESTLKLFLIEGKYTKELLENSNGGLRALSNKINTCAALGIITDDQAKSLHAIRKIRNEFAHDWKIDSIEQFKDHVDNIKDIQIPDLPIDKSTAIGKFKANAPFVLSEIISNHLVISSRKLQISVRDTIYT